MMNWLDELKVGDECFLGSSNGISFGSFKRVKVSNVTKTHVTAEGWKYRKQDGSQVSKKLARMVMDMPRLYPITDPNLLMKEKEIQFKWERKCFLTSEAWLKMSPEGFSKVRDLAEKILHEEKVSAELSKP